MILKLVVGSLCGAGFALVFYWITTLPQVWTFLLPGILIGGLFGYYWQAIVTLLMRFQSDDWHVTEIEINTLGHKWKLANSGSQRRVAWSIFVESITRIATQPMSDMHGDNGIALKSLYNLFQTTRSSITNVEPTSIMPSATKCSDTVETYALSMLNEDLRPFLSKWHPTWDTWRKDNPDVPSYDWDQHTEFRTDLKDLQSKMRERAEGLAKIAGVSEINRFMRGTTSINNEIQE